MAHRRTGYIWGWNIGSDCVQNSAGIIGLDVAYVLVQRGLAPNITVVAEHMPGDTSANYTSPW